MGTVPKKVGNAPKTQDAHEAIRPTDITRTKIKSDDQRVVRLYHLIWRNSLESCMSEATFKTFTANIQSLKYKYNYKTEQVIFEGWKGVVGQRGKDSIFNFLLNIENGTVLDYNKIYSKVTLKKKKCIITKRS